MESIISPWFVYFVSLVDSLSNVITFFAVIAGLIAVIYITGIMVNRGEENEDAIEQWKRGWGKIGIATIVLSIILIPLAVFMPTKNTLIAMYVANEVTYDRVEKAGEIAKDVKDEIKKDFMDILEMFMEDGEVKDEDNK